MKIGTHAGPGHSSGHRQGLLRTEEGRRSRLAGFGVAPWKLPLVVAAIAVPIAVAFYVGGPGVGLAVGALAAVAIVVVAARQRPRGAIGERPRRASGAPPAGRRQPARSRIRRRSTRSRPRSRGRQRPGPAEVLVLSPARIGFLDRWASDVEGARREAQRRLVITRRLAGQAGVDAEARVGDEDLVQAVEDQLGSFAATEVILVTGRRRGGRAAARPRRPELRQRLRARVPAAGRQRSSSSLKRSAARVGATKSSLRCSRPAPARSRTARSTASRSAKLGGSPAELAHQFLERQLGRVEVEQLPQDGRLDRRVFGGRRPAVVGLVHPPCPSGR